MGETADLYRHTSAAWLARRRHAFAVVAPYGLLIVAPLLIWAVALYDVAGRNALAVDFHHFFYPHARDVLDGRTPPTAYPALASLAYVPLALLPRFAGDVILVVLLTACAVGVMRVLDVRDWRCYGAAALWAPTFSAVQTGNLSLVLALGVALLWVWRERPVRAGLLVAAVVALKLFLWPLLLWLALTGRWRALAVSLTAGLAASAAAWSVVGFGALSHFPSALQSNVHVSSSLSYTVSGLLQALGIVVPVANAVCWTIGGAILVIGCWLAMRGEDRRSLSVMLLAALMFSPVVWLHYLSLLLIPVALASPRLSVLWLAPMALILCPPVGGDVAAKAFVLSIEIGVVALATSAPADAAAPSWLRPIGGRHVTVPPVTPLAQSRA